MKKLFISLCMVLVGLCASAQKKGDMAIGLNLGVAPCLESGSSVTNFGIGAKFQYNVSNPIRLEADLDYWFKDKGVDVFDITANVHYLFNVGSKAKLYPIVGIGYARLKASAKMDIYGDKFTISATANKFLFNLGAGIEYPVTEKVAIGAEIKYQYISDFNRLPIYVGITYKF